MTGIWAIGFVFAEIIPSMGEFISLLDAAFDSFGFIYFAVAWWHLYMGNLFSGEGRSLLTLIHIVVLLVGLFLLGPGLCAAVEALPITPGRLDPRLVVPIWLPDDKFEDSILLAESLGDRCQAAGTEYI